MSARETLAKNLSELMHKKGIDQNRLADDIGVSQSTISNWLQQKKYPRIDKIEILAKYFGVPKSKLTETKESLQAIPAIKVPVVSKISAGLPLYDDSNIIEYSHVPAHVNRKGRELFYLRVSGDSMNKEFSDGDLVLIEKDSPIENGQIGVVQVNGYNATVKRVRYDEDKIILYPESTNPDHLPQIYTLDDSVQCIGRVISVQKFY